MADQNPSDAPSLPPIPTIPFQGPPLDQPAPSIPTEMAAASLNSSIDNDEPISEVVTALKSAPLPILTEVKEEKPVATPQTPTASAASSPVAPVSTPTPTPATPPVAPPAAVTPKGPLYEDPDLVKVPGAS